MRLASSRLDASLDALLSAARPLARLAVLSSAALLTVALPVAFSGCAATSTPAASAPSADPVWSPAYGLPVPSAPAPPFPAPPHDTLAVVSVVLGETRTVNVYTPPGYDTDDARYPVLYMPDGGTEEDFPHVAASLDAAVRAGEVRPMLLVGVENIARRYDTTGPTEVASDREIAPRVGGSAGFRAFFGDELTPEIDRRYRTTGETAIIGESLAGLFIVETFLLAPETFDTYVALSPSLWWNDEALVRGAPATLAAHPDLRATLYLSSADEAEDIVPQTERLAAALEEHAPRGLRWTYAPRPDLRHDNIYRVSAPAVLRAVFPSAP